MAVSLRERAVLDLKNAHCCIEDRTSTGIFSLGTLVFVLMMIVTNNPFSRRTGDKTHTTLKMDLPFDKFDEKCMNNRYTRCAVQIKD